MTRELDPFGQDLEVGKPHWWSHRAPGTQSSPAPLTRRKESDDAFTLIELLIVIIVLGILVAIVLFSLGAFKGQSQTAACQADSKQLKTAETAYYLKNNVSGTVGALVVGNYLQSRPSTTADGRTLSVSWDTTTATANVSPSC